MSRRTDRTPVYQVNFHLSQSWMIVVEGADLDRCPNISLFLRLAFALLRLAAVEAGLFSRLFET